MTPAHAASRPRAASRARPLARQTRGVELGARHVPYVGWIIGLYAVARLVSGVLLAVLTRYQVPVGWTGEHVTYGTIVGLWDAGWYSEIAQHGYPHELPRDPYTGDLQQNPWAFYPLFPVLTRLVMGLTGAPFALAGATLSLLLGGAAAVVIGTTLRDHVGPRAALAAVVVWATCAPSPVLQVAYTESLAILLLALVLRFLDREQWWAAAGCAFLTGLARPIAVPLGVVALVAVVVRWRRRADRPIQRREGTGMLAALAGCGLAGLTWPLVAWLGTGVRTAYTDTMATWRHGQNIVPLTPWVGISEWFFRGAGSTAARLALAAIVALLLGLALGPWAARLGPVLRTWILAYPFYLAVVLDPGTSVIRYLLPCFPWAVIAVDGAWRGAPSAVRTWALAAGWAALGVATQWWWLYELWRFVPPSDFPP